MSDLPARLRNLSSILPRFVEPKDQDQIQYAVDTLWTAATEIERLLDSLPHTPESVSTAPPRGCICPPTSEQTCQSLTCPRRGPSVGIG